MGARLLTSDHRFIFVCGLHRSGTSILFRCLRDHPKISGFNKTGVPKDEGIYLQSLYPQPHGYLGRAGSFGFDQQEHLTEASSLISETSQQQLLADWGQHWNLEKPFLLEKSPPHLIKMRFLQAIFPQSYFIIVLRHPLAVSYATRRWYRHFKIYWIRLARVLAHWLHCYELGWSDLPHLNRIFVLHYEEFVLQPEHWLTTMCDFLGIDHFKSTQQVKSSINQKYFSMWRRDQKFFLGRRETQRIIARYEQRCHRFGYSLEDVNFLQPLPPNGSSTLAGDEEDNFC